MLVRLFDYNYVVQYLPGVKNTVADFLSRMPLPAKDTDEDGKEEIWVAIVNEGICRGITRNEWNAEQYLDEKICSVCMVYAENGYRRSRMPRASNATHSGYVDREAFENGKSGVTVVEVYGTPALSSCINYA
ncbi:hypothetical protein NDU88_001011 [Pleurodeles waltl]|uniref:Uncharacterized protein n=1 Tax=Pleurodeles waltl TaxID=8319 RepID=A0AAV7SY26_PLEWA|nr:hypothetical protein NDU88_001011 [Pleurodeles waltl]